MAKELPTDQKKQSPKIYTRREFLKEALRRAGKTTLALSMGPSFLGEITKYILTPPSQEKQQQWPPPEYISYLLAQQNDLDYLQTFYNDEGQPQAMFSFEQDYQFSLSPEAPQFIQDYVVGTHHLDNGFTEDVQRMLVESGEWSQVISFFSQYLNYPHALIAVKTATETASGAFINPNFHILIGHSYQDDEGNPLLLDWLRASVYRYEAQGQDPRAELLGLPITLTQEINGYQTQLRYQLTDLQIMNDEDYNDGFKKITQTIYSGNNEATPQQERVVGEVGKLNLTPPPDQKPGFVLITCYARSLNGYLYAQRILAQFELVDSSVITVPDSVQS